MKKALWIVLAVLAIGSPDAKADGLTVQNTPAGAVMGGVYTSPYEIAVNGTPTLLICDDFETDISLGYSWSASSTTLTQISSATVGGLKFASSSYDSAILGGTNVAEDYATAGVLAAEMLSLPNIGTPSEDTELVGELSYAIWSLFDNSLYTSLNSTGSTGYGSLTPGEVADVDADIVSAQALVAGATVGGITNLNNISINGQPINSLSVYTPNPLSASQEFITISAPEPGSFAFTLIGLGSLGMMMVMRKRKAQGLAQAA
jgi:hypothetical protein